MNRYITVKKIEFAKELIREKTNMKLSEVSELRGYGDYRYFSWVFKTETGLSPSEYKDSIST